MAFFAGAAVDVLAISDFVSSLVLAVVAAFTSVGAGDAGVWLVSDATVVSIAGGVVSEAPLIEAGEPGHGRHDRSR